MIKRQFSKTTFIFLLSIFLSTPLFAQLQESYEAEISRGLTLLRANKMAAAISALKRAIEIAPDSIRAVKLLGQIEAKKGDWKETRDLMNKVVEKNPDDLAAHYYLGISYREIGKTKALLLRRLDWKKSQKNFEFVLKVAPWYQDVYYQYGILERYRGHYFKALEFAEKQLTYLPNSRHVRVGLHHLYDLMIFHEGPEQARQWLSEREYPRALFYIGETYRRDKEFAKADSIFQLVLDSGDSTISYIPVLLSLVRLRIQQDRQDEADAYFRQALDSVKTFIDADLIFEDMKYIASDDEIAQFFKAKTIEEKKSIIKKFWIKRNPLRAAPENVRLVEHFRRLIYAEKNFRFDGFRLWFNNPDKQNYLRFSRSYYLNDKFNDKGLVYLRLGEPDDRAFDVQELTMQNESWLYYGQGIGQKLMFHFFIDKNASGNNWRLAAELPRSLLQSRLTWDPIFQRMYTASNLEMQQYRMQLIQKSARDVLVGFNADRHTWSKKIVPISFPFYVSTFRGTKDSTRFEIYYGLNAKDIWNKKEKVPKEQKIDLGFSVYDSDWNRVLKANRTVDARQVKRQSDSLDFWVDQFVFQGAPATYNLNLYVRIPEDNKLGGFKFKFGLPSYQRPKLQMSAIELARNITPTDRNGPFIKHGLKVIPQPYRFFKKSQPVYVYFEVYNLPFKNGRQVPFKITYTLKLLKSSSKNIFKKIARLFGKKRSEITNTIERYANDKDSFEYLAMDLQDKIPGHYRLTIKTLVPDIDEEASSKIEFDLK